MYAVCTVRIRPVRAEGLQFGNGAEVTNPLVVAQIQPWKKTRRTNELYGGGENPRWINTEDTKENTKNYYLDLPYYGHPYSGKVPSVTVMVLNVSKEEIDESDEEGTGSFSALSPELIGRASFDLRPYLSENKNVMHGLTLSLKDQKQNYVGKIVCTLQFVLTGVMRLTVLSGNRLRSNVQENEDIEPYVEAKLVPGKNKWRRTVHKQGENPEWGQYTRKATLGSFNFTKLNIFSSKSSFDGSQNRRNGRTNILEFKYKDEDRSVIPVLNIQVKDKMDTMVKREKHIEEEKKRVLKLEKQIKQLRRKSKKIATSMSANIDGSPKISSKTFAGMFRRGNPRSSTAKRKKKAKPNFEEVNVNAPPPHLTTLESLEDLPLTASEAGLMKRLKAASKRLKRMSKGAENVMEDHLIARGSIDLRPLLKYDGKRTGQTVTVDLTDENGLASGNLTCTIEFENYAYDPNQEVLKIPDFDLSGVSYRDIISMLGNFKAKDIVFHAKNMYILLDVGLDMYAPRFVKKTSAQTKMPKVVVFTVFFSFTLLFLLSLWKGLGNEFLSFIVCVLYPTYQSFKALENKNTDLNNQWLTYWIIYGAFNFLEKTVLLPLIFVYPTLFFIAKTFLFLWLTNPSTLGASIIYYMAIAPLMRSYQDDIDAYISVFGKTTRNFVTDFAGFYDEFEQEMSFAVSKNLVAKGGYFANENFRSKTFRKPFSSQVREMMDDSSVSPMNGSVLKVLVTTEGKGRGKMMKIDVDDKLEDVLLQACGKMGIDKFQDYQLFYFNKGKPQELEDISQLEMVSKPRILIKSRVS